MLAHSSLFAAAERKNHPPMAELKIALPGSPTFLFQKLFFGFAKGAQMRIAGNNDLFGIGSALSWIAGNDLSNQAAVCRIIGPRLGWVKTGIAKKLLGAASDDETMLSIGRFWVTPFGRPLARGIILVHPEQLIGVGESVFGEVKGTGRDGGAGAAEEEEAKRKKT